MGSVKGVSRGKYKKNTLRVDGEVYCSQCNKKYKRRTSLLQHIRSRHLKLQINCGHCSKKFSSVSTQKRHQRTVHGNDKKIKLSTKTPRAKCTIDTTKKKKCKSKSRHGKVSNTIPNSNQEEIRTVVIKSEPLVNGETFGG